MPESFKIKKTFIVYDGMCEPPDNEIEVTITNDCLDILDGEFVKTSWWSALQCKAKNEVTSEVPSDEQIASWLLKSERAETVYPAD